MEQQDLFDTQEEFDFGEHSANDLPITEVKDLIEILLTVKNTNCVD